MAGTPSEAFYEGIEASFLENGLSRGFTNGILNGVHDLDPKTADMAEFEKSGGFGDELADVLTGLAVRCVAPTP